MLWLLPLLLGCRDRLAPEGYEVERGAAFAWHELLQEAVDDRGDVDYAAIEARREVLDRYVTWLGRPTGMRGRTPDQAHAFWINAFNGLVIYQVLERDLESSVLEVGGVLPFKGAGFYVGTEFVVAGEPLSLWEIGHERLTHLNQDYRDFLVLSIGTRSGPPLKQGLFNATELDRELWDQTRVFFESDRAMRFGEDGTVSFNPILDHYWPEIELYRYGVTRCELAGRHTTGERQARLLALEQRGCPHDFFEFDWSLNRSEEAP